MVHWYIPTTGSLIAGEIAGDSMPFVHPITHWRALLAPFADMEEVVLHFLPDGAEVRGMTAERARIIVASAPWLQAEAMHAITLPAENMAEVFGAKRLDPPRPKKGEVAANGLVRLDLSSNPFVVEAEDGSYRAVVERPATPPSEVAGAGRSKDPRDYGHSHPVRLRRSLLLDALADTAAPGEARPEVRLRREGGILFLVTGGETGTRVRVRIDTDTGEDADTCFDATLLVELLKGMNSEEVLLHVPLKEQPLLLEAKGLVDVVAVLAPRLEGD